MLLFGFAEYFHSMKCLVFLLSLMYKFWKQFPTIKYGQMQLTSDQKHLLILNSCVLVRVTLTAVTNNSKALYTIHIIKVALHNKGLFLINIPESRVDEGGCGGPCYIQCSETYTLSRLCLFHLQPMASRSWHHVGVIHLVG